MKITIDEKSGFCFGVVRAIEIAEKTLAESGASMSLGDIVHNRLEVNRLEAKGLRTVTLEQVEPQNTEKNIIIRAHGEPPATYAKARELGVSVIDATCPVVAKLQERVKRGWEQMEPVGGQVVILGKRGHAEVVGLTGQIDDRALVIENLEDMAAIDFARPIYFLSQTTQSLTLFDQVRTELLSRAEHPERVYIHDTICRQVAGRAPHLREFAQRYDVIIFVAGRKSSNGRALFEVCRAANPCTYMVEEASELTAEMFAGGGKVVASVGICGATSTPRWQMETVATAVGALGGCDVVL